VWDEFEWGAVLETGEPRLLCRKCEKVIRNPIAGGASVGNLKNYLQSQNCQKSAGGQAAASGGKSGPGQVSTTQFQVHFCRRKSCYAAANGHIYPQTF
jgi:hypothetical protein